VLNDKTARDLYFGHRFDAGSIIEGKDAFNSSLNAQSAERRRYENEWDDQAA
jgi:hypothetical protein